MGRLMDSILAAIGMKHSDRVSFEPDTQGIGSTVSVQSKEKLLKQIESKATVDIESIKSKTSIASQEESKDVKFMAVESKPMDKDCLGCRIVGSGTMLVLGGYFIWLTYKTRTNQKGFRRTVHVINGSIFSSGFLLVAVCNFFKIGPFDPSRENMTIQQQMKAEARTFCKVFHIEIPKFLTDEHSLTDDNKDQRDGS